MQAAGMPPPHQEDCQFPSHHTLKLIKQSEIRSAPVSYNVYRPDTNAKLLNFTFPNNFYLFFISITSSLRCLSVAILWWRHWANAFCSIHIYYIDWDRFHRFAPQSTGTCHRCAISFYTPIRSPFDSHERTKRANPYTLHFNFILCVCCLLLLLFVSL